MSLMQILGGFLAFFTIDRFGRRSLMLVGSIMMAISLAILAGNDRRYRERPRTGCWGHLPFRLQLHLYRRPRRLDISLRDRGGAVTAASGHQRRLHGGGVDFQLLVGGGHTGGIQHHREQVLYHLCGSQRVDRPRRIFLFPRDEWAHAGGD